MPVKQAARAGIQRQNFAVLCGVAGSTVIGGHQQEAVGHTGARPVKARRRIRPRGRFALPVLRRIFVRHAEADKIGLLCLGIPEACVKIAVQIGDGAVRLSAQSIFVQPQGFEALGVKGLHRAVGQGDKDHALAVGGRRDGKAGSVIHRLGEQHFPGLPVHLHHGVVGVGVKHAAHQNGRTHAAAGEAVADFVCPVKHRVFRYNWRPCGSDAIVFRVSAEA